MFKAPPSGAKTRPPTNVHFVTDPPGTNPSGSAFVSQSATFDADVSLYTLAEILDNGVPTSEWASVSAGPSSLLVTNAMYPGSVGHTMSMRVKHTVVSGGGYSSDSDWVTCPETYVVDP